LLGAGRREVLVRVFLVGVVEDGWVYCVVCVGGGMGGRTKVETVDMVAVGFVGMLLWEIDLSDLMMLL
jgi:hypothetical protein